MKIKNSAIKIIDGNPERYEICSSCNGTGFGKYFIYVSGNMVINGAITFPVMAGNAPTTYDAVISTSNAAGAAILPIGRYLYNSLGFPAEAASGCKGATSASTPTNGGGGGGSAGQAARVELPTAARVLVIPGRWAALEKRRFFLLLGVVFHLGQLPQARARGELARRA